MITRSVESQIKKRLFRGKAIIIYGPRQVGKTTLAKAVLASYADKVLHLNGDDSDSRTSLANTNATVLQNLLGEKSILFIDEAQRFENIGLCIKIAVDQLPEIQVVATGSSSFELADRIKESLAGRAWEYRLFPLSYAEIAQETSPLTEKRLLEQRMVYGYYPDVVNNPGDSQQLLHSLADSALYKDIMTLEQIRKPVLLQKLLKALALQLGNEVSFNELAQLIGSNRETAERYVDILEKSFILHTLPAFSGNLRNEIKLGKKIYFCDNGIRNAVIDDFRPVGLRADTGALWENFLIMERKKYLSYNALFPAPYFWRTTQQQEVDYIEQGGGALRAWEFKWNPDKRAYIPLTFSKNYQPAQQGIITSRNFEEFIYPENS